MAKAAIADEQARNSPNPVIRCNLEVLAAEWRAASLTLSERHSGAHILEAAE